MAGARVGGRVLISMWSFCCKEGWCVALSRGLGVVERKDSGLPPKRKFHIGPLGSPAGIVVSLWVFCLSVPRPDFLLQQ